MYLISIQFFTKAFDLNFRFQPNDLMVLLPITSTMFGFIAYWFLANSSKIKAFFYEKISSDLASFYHVHFSKWLGFICMGVLPFWVCYIGLERSSFASFGLTYRSETAFFSLAWILGLCILVIPLAYLSAKKPKNFENYPQIRTKFWTQKIFILNLIGWAVYLLGYEMLFRGVLLFPTAKIIGIWPSIAINVALYSATHIPKGFDETIGAIPLGIVLCILTLQSQTIWIAFFVHLALAWTNSLTALKHHPEIGYIKWKRK